MNLRRIFKLDAPGGFGDPIQAPQAAMRSSLSSESELVMIWAGKSTRLIPLQVASTQLSHKIDPSEWSRLRRTRFLTPSGMNGRADPAGQTGGGV